MKNLQTAEVTESLLSYIVAGINNEQTCANVVIRRNMCCTSNFMMMTMMMLMMNIQLTTYLNNYFTTLAFRAVMGYLHKQIAVANA